jgi:hypothetical protein
MLNQADLEKELLLLGFTKLKENSKTIPYKNGDTVVYVKVDTVKEPLVVHPDNQHRFGALDVTPNVQTTRPMRFYHNATMRHFPSRLNTGQVETKYGIAFGLENRAALKNLLDKVLENESATILHDLDAVKKDAITDTEKSELKKHE